MELKEMFCLEGKVAVVTGGGGHPGDRVIILSHFPSQHEWESAINRRIPRVIEFRNVIVRGGKNLHK